jgi:hypothetical protein
MVVSFSALTTHYSPSPNSPFDGAMIIRGRRGTKYEGHGGEAWSFARRPKQQEMTSRAPFAATYGPFRPGLDVLLIHLLEATDVTLPGESTLVRRILDDRTAATSAPSGRGAAPPALLSITMREVAFSRRRAGARMIGALAGNVARRTLADMGSSPLAVIGTSLICLSLCAAAIWPTATTPSR